VVHVKLPRFAVVDLETSGVSSRRHRILQLGMVTIEPDGTVVDEWSTMVRLRWRFSRVGPTHLHGITRSMLKEAPGLDPVLDELGGRLGDAVFTAHNARFDGGFLARAARRRPPDDPVRAGLAPRLCTLRLSRCLDPDRLRSHQLADVCARYGVALDRPHDALSDARATAAVLPHLLDAHGITAAEQLTPFYDRESVAA
jgi:DNA polymerase-3 subunit epsilon